MTIRTEQKLEKLVNNKNLRARGNLGLNRLIQYAGDGNHAELQFRLNELIEAISNGITELDRGTKDILHALNNISRISDENCQHTELLASRMRELKTRNNGGNE